MRGRVRAHGSVYVAVAAGLATIAGLGGMAGARQADAALARSAPTPSLALDVALTATANASSGAGAGKVIDGNASSRWCSRARTATITLDLHGTRPLVGFGVTLGATAAKSRVAFSYATAAGHWRGLGQASVPTGQPLYWPRAFSARWVKLTVTGGRAPCVGELRLFAPAARGVVPDRGADVSFEAQEEAAGARFADGGVRGSALSILTHHGVNFVRLRLWINPPPGYSNLAADLRMAKRIKAAGDRFFLDLHYSDTWADPSYQAIPKAWRGENLAQLTTTLHDYTAKVVRAFAAQGTAPDLVSIGNEIRNGILWPFGKLNWRTNAGWSNLTRLLRAGVAGARATNPRHHRMLVVLHIDTGGNAAQSRSFFAHMVAGHVPFDVIGLSYYPFFHGSLSAMRANVDALAARFARPVVLAEFGYPWTLANGDRTRNYASKPSQVSVGYPATPGGQLSFANDALSILAQVPHHRGLGLFYWEPEWIPGVDSKPGVGSQTDNLTLFSFHGQALPSIGLFGNPLTVCGHADPGARPCRVPDLSGTVSSGA